MSAISSKWQTSSLIAVSSWSYSKSLTSLLMLIFEWFSWGCWRKVSRSITSKSGIKISHGSWHWIVVSRALLKTGLFDITVQFEQTILISWWHLLCDRSSTSSTIKSLEKVEVSILCKSLIWKIFYWKKYNENYKTLLALAIVLFSIRSAKLLILLSFFTSNPIWWSESLIDIGIVWTRSW